MTSLILEVLFFFSWFDRSSGPWLRLWDSSFTPRHSTRDRTPLDEWSARRRHLYLITHNSYQRKTSMPSAGFEPAISARERPQTHALDRAATGIFHWKVRKKIMWTQTNMAAHCFNLHHVLLRCFPTWKSLFITGNFRAWRCEVTRRYLHF